MSILRSKLKSNPAASAAALVAAIFSTSAYSAITQPDPAGSVLEGRLSAANENGAYTVKAPYTEGVTNAVGKLYTEVNENGKTFSSNCTGSILNNDTRRNLIITAAHCFADLGSDNVWRKKSWLDATLNAKTISFLPAFDGTKGGAARTPYGSWTVKSVNLLTDKTGVDVALLEVAPNANGSNIRDVVGRGYDVHASIKSGENVQATLVGYPGPAPFFGNSQSACVGNYTHHDSRGNATISRIDNEKECWVGGGASGGPYLSQPTSKGGSPQVITVLNSDGGGDIASVYDRLLKLLK